jgi:hypothetical protein
LTILGEFLGKDIADLLALLEVLFLLSLDLCVALLLCLLSEIGLLLLFCPLSTPE